MHFRSLRCQLVELQLPQPSGRGLGATEMPRQNLWSFYISGGRNKYLSAILMWKPNHSFDPPHIQIQWIMLKVSWTRKTELKRFCTHVEGHGKSKPQVIHKDVGVPDSIPWFMIIFPTEMQTIEGKPVISVQNNHISGSIFTTPHHISRKYISIIYIYIHYLFPFHFGNWK